MSMFAADVISTSPEVVVFSCAVAAVAFKVKECPLPPETLTLLSPTLISSAATEAPGAAAKPAPFVILTSLPASLVKYRSFGVSDFTQSCPYAAVSASAFACSLSVSVPSTVNFVFGLVKPIPTLLLSASTDRVVLSTSKSSAVTSVALIVVTLVLLPLKSPIIYSVIPEPVKLYIEPAGICVNSAKTWYAKLSVVVFCDTYNFVHLTSKVTLANPEGTVIK